MTVKYVQGKVQSSDVTRIIHAMALVFGGELSLNYYVRNRKDMWLPDNLRLFEAKRFWPVRNVQLDEETKTLRFRKWNETVEQSIQMTLPNQQITHALRLNIYDRAFGKRADRAAGFTDYGQYY